MTCIFQPVEYQILISIHFKNVRKTLLYFKGLLLSFEKWSLSQTDFIGCNYMYHTDSQTNKPNKRDDSIDSLCLNEAMLIKASPFLLHMFDDGTQVLYVSM